MVGTAMTERNHDLSGSWSGYYEQDGGRHGISMVVAQRGSAIVGRMHDVDTVLLEQMQVTAPGATADVTAMIELPETALIEGDVEGHVVSFTKRYEGAQKTTVWWGRRKEQHEESSHSVQYRGRLDATGDVLSGTWQIPPSDRGRFELRRQPH